MTDELDGLADSSRPTRTRNRRGLAIASHCGLIAPDNVTVLPSRRSAAVSSTALEMCTPVHIRGPAPYGRYACGSWTSSASQRAHLRAQVALQIADEDRTGGFEKHALAVAHADGRVFGAVEELFEVQTDDRDRPFGEWRRLR